MRRIALGLLVTLVACTDPGPRDRSLVRRSETFPVHPAVFDRQIEATRTDPTAPVLHVGLRTDPLAELYPKDAGLVVRCADLATLHRHAKKRLARFAELLPEWGLPDLPPGTLLRVRCGVPDGVLIDRLRPFAFVETSAGWVVLVPIADAFDDLDHLRRIEGRYCVAGSPEAVRAYEPGGQVGQYLDGDISVMARGEEVARFGKRLTDVAALLNMKLPGLGALPGKAFAGIQRADLALRCLKSSVRVELRIVPDPQRARTLATLVDALDARASRALGWLPSNGVITAASGCDVASLLTLSAQFDAVALDPNKPARLAILNDAIATLGDDSAVCLQIDSNDRPTLLVIAELTEPDRRRVERFLESEKIDSLLEELGGPANTLAYEPTGFKRHGNSIGTIRGLPAREVIATLRAQPGLGEQLARLFARDGRIHVALAGNRLCVTMGENGRGAMESLLDRLHGVLEAGAAPAARSNGMCKLPLFEASFDAGALCEQLRHAASGVRRERLPVELGIEREGTALRMTLQLPLERIAATWGTRPAMPAAPAEDAPTTRD